MSAPFDAFRACRDSADLEAVAVLSRFNALDVARERLGDALLLPERPFAKSRCLLAYLAAAAATFRRLQVHSGSPCL